MLKEQDVRWSAVFATDEETVLSPFHSQTGFHFSVLLELSKSELFRSMFAQFSSVSMRVGFTPVEEELSVVSRVCSVWRVVDPIHLFTGSIRGSAPSEICRVYESLKVCNAEPLDPSSAGPLGMQAESLFWFVP